MTSIITVAYTKRHTGMNHEPQPSDDRPQHSNEAVFNELTQDVFPVRSITDCIRFIQHLTDKHLTSLEGKYFATQDDVDNELARISEVIDAELAENGILSVGNRLVMRPTPTTSTFEAIRKKGNNSVLSEIQLGQDDYIEGVFAGVLVDEALIETEIREAFTGADDAFVPHYITALTSNLCLYYSTVFPAEDEAFLLDKQCVVFVPLEECYPQLGRIIPPSAA